MTDHAVAARAARKEWSNASDLLQDIFGEDKDPSRLTNGVTSLPLGTPVALGLIFEVA